MKGVVSILFIALVLVAEIPSACAAYTVYCTNCSDKFVQRMERVTNVDQLKSLWKEYRESVMQTEQQIRMVMQNIEQYQNMVINTISLPNAIMNSVKGDFQRLGQLGKQLSTTVGEIGALEQLHNTTYPDFDAVDGLVNMPIDIRNKMYGEYYAKWSKRIDDASVATFQLTGAQLAELNESAEFDDQIDELLSTPEGRMQALQAGNQLAAIQLGEARKMRALTATYIQEQNQRNEKEEKERQLEQKERERMLDTSALEGASYDNAPPMPLFK